VSGLEWRTRMVFREIFPRTNARPAVNTAAVEMKKPGLIEISRKLPRPKAMLVARATRTEVRSVYHPAKGAQTDCARTYPFRIEAIRAYEKPPRCSKSGKI